MNIACRIAVSMLALGAGTSAASSNLSFLNSSPAARFTAQDYQLLQAAALGLLTDGVEGATRDWSNPATAASGKLTVIKEFTSTEGFHCKSLRVENRAGTRRGRATYPVCETQPGDWQIHAAAKPAVAAKPTLEATSWRAIHLGAQPVVLADGQPEPVISFEAADRRVAGFGGCNRIVGSYEHTGNRLKLSQTASTRMACIRGMDLEQQLLKALESTAGWRIADSQLELLDSGGAVLARFKAK